MPANVTPQYKKAEREYSEARTTEEKIEALKKMLSLAPTHKGAENLRADIKRRLAKLKSLLEKERRYKSKGRNIMWVKKEGDAQIVILGMTNSGKSTLLKRLTNVNVKISQLPFTTTKPEIGMLDYKGVKLQIIEIPAIVENFTTLENSSMLLGIIRQADIAIIVAKDKKEIEIIKNELKKANIEMGYIIYCGESKEELSEKIWKNLDLIKVFTKQPHQKPNFPPVVLKKNSTVRDLAEKIHEDFIDKFKFARVYGRSVKFNGIKVGLNHILEDDDIVELHTR